MLTIRLYQEELLAASFTYGAAPLPVRRGGLVYSIREESDTVRIRLGDNP